MNVSLATRVTLLRGADLVASPWKNGGGVTREIAAEPSGAALDAFRWRISVADVAQAGPFSRFAGVDRTLVLLDGAGMLLEEEGGRTHALMLPFEMAQFAGESAVSARLADGATRDFNVMVRRDVVRAAVEVWRTPISHRIAAQTTLLVHCARATAAVAVQHGDAYLLTAGDTLRIDAEESVTLHTRGSGILLAVALVDLTNPNQGCAELARTP